MTLTPLIHRHLSTVNLKIDSTMELDSHADTCCLGKHALIIQDFNIPVTGMTHVNTELNLMTAKSQNLLQM